MKNKLLYTIFCLQFITYSLQLYAQEVPIVNQTEEVKGFTMTIIDKGGREKAAISGSLANILPGGLIEIMDAVARIYGQGGVDSDTLVHTSKGIYNKIREIVFTDQFVRINRRDMVITGIGLEWFPKFSKIKIENNVRVEYLAEQPADTPQKKRPVVITSEGSGFLDYGKDMAVLKEKVMVIDADVILKAHRMKIFFNDKTKGLQRVEAYGNVKIKQPKRESISKKAVYYVDEDRVELTGYPRIVQGFDLYTAEKITLYDRGNRVVFEPKAQLVIFAETEHGEI